MANKEQIEQRWREDKWSAFLYWYRTPFAVLKSLAGWPTIVKAPAWLLLVVFGEFVLFFIVIIVGEGRVDPPIPWEVIFQSYRRVLVQAIALSLVSIIVLLLIFIIVRVLKKPAEEMMKNNDR